MTRGAIMAATAETTSYAVEGRVLEVCTCKVLCPCWVGEDPDGDGTCDSIIGWYVDRGTVDGVDVSDRCLCLSVHIPGNMLAGKWRAAVLVDDRCDDGQQCALLDVFTGRLGGPIADLAGLIGEVVAVERVPIAFDVVDGRGRIEIGDVAEARIDAVPGRDRAEHLAARHGVLHRSRDRPRSSPGPTRSVATAAGTGYPTSRSAGTTPSRARSGSRADMPPRFSTPAHRPRPGRRHLGRGGDVLGPRRPRSSSRGSLGVLPRRRGPGRDDGASSRRTVFAAWLVMIGAMMLPTAVPLARMFVVVTARVPRPVGARVAFLAGYLALWSGFAAAAMLGDSGVDALLGRAADRPGSCWGPCSS